MEVFLTVEEVDMGDVTMDEIERVVEENFEMKERQELLCGTTTQTRMVQPKSDAVVSEVQVKNQVPRNFPTSGRPSATLPPMGSIPYFEMCNLKGH